MRGVSQSTVKPTRSHIGARPCVNWGESFMNQAQVEQKTYFV
jgi:hypothetical protein